MTNANANAPDIGDLAQAILRTLRQAREEARALPPGMTAADREAVLLTGCLLDWLAETDETAGSLESLRLEEDRVEDGLTEDRLVPVVLRLTPLAAVELLERARGRRVSLGREAGDLLERLLLPEDDLANSIPPSDFQR